MPELGFFSDFSDVFVEVQNNNNWLMLPLSADWKILFPHIKEHSIFVYV
jgi:hypothetical protein